MATPCYDIPAARAKAVVRVAVSPVFTIADTAAAQAHPQAAQTRAGRY
jgi:hypothetical protein